MSWWISQEVVEAKHIQKNIKLIPIVIKRIYLSNMNKLIVQRRIICLIELKRPRLTYLVSLQATTMTSHLCQITHLKMLHHERLVLLVKLWEFLVHHDDTFSLKPNPSSQVQQRLKKLRKKFSIWILNVKKVHLVEVTPFAFTNRRLLISSLRKHLQQKNGGVILNLSKLKWGLKILSRSTIYKEIRDHLIK